MNEIHINYPVDLQGAQCQLLLAELVLTDQPGDRG
jgi:hypothetical protein